MNCPLCGARTARLVGRVAPATDFLQCGRCTGVYCRPIPDRAGLAGFYHTQFYAGVSTRKSHWKERLLRRFYEGSRPPLIRNQWRTYPRARVAGRILDVGAGTGEFVADLAALGMDVVGLELSAEACRAAARRGLRMIQGDWASASFRDASFEFLRMHHVLEHMVDPPDALRRAARALAPGGELVVAVPNFDSIQARLGTARWLASDFPAHLYHFTPRALRLLVEGAGLAVRSVECFFSLHLVAGDWIRGFVRHPHLVIPGLRIGGPWVRGARVGDEIVLRATKLRRYTHGASELRSPPFSL